ncbi:MAG: hypothetical protein ACERLG_03155, partial [Sedimentibacter sp.]
ALPRFSGVTDNAKENACLSNRTIAESSYMRYLANGGTSITNGTTGTDFLVDNELLDKEITCPSGGSYKWVVDGSGNAYLSCSVHNPSENISDFVMNSMIDLLKSFEGKTNSEIATILGSNSISNDTYRAYLLANVFNGTWPSFPEELQSQVTNGDTLKIMSFSNSTDPDDPVVYSSSNTGNVWSAGLFYYPGKGWYRYINSYGSYVNITFSSLTGTSLKNKIDSEPSNWKLID